MSLSNLFEFIVDISFNLIVKVSSNNAIAPFDVEIENIYFVANGSSGTPSAYSVFEFYNTGKNGEKQILISRFSNRDVDVFSHGFNSLEVVKLPIYYNKLGEGEFLKGVIDGQGVGFHPFDETLFTIETTKL